MSTIEQVIKELEFEWSVTITPFIYLYPVTGESVHRRSFYLTMLKSDKFITFNTVDHRGLIDSLHKSCYAPHRNLRRSLHSLAKCYYSAKYIPYIGYIPNVLWPEALAEPHSGRWPAKAFLIDNNTFSCVNTAPRISLPPYPDFKECYNALNYEVYHFLYVNWCIPLRFAGQQIAPAPPPSSGHITTMRDDTYKSAVQSLTKDIHKHFPRTILQQYTIDICYIPNFRGGDRRPLEYWPYFNPLTNPQSKVIPTIEHAIQRLFLYKKIINKLYPDCPNISFNNATHYKDRSELFLIQHKTMKNHNSLYAGGISRY